MNRPEPVNRRFSRRQENKKFHVCFTASHREAQESEIKNTAFASLLAFVIALLRAQGQLRMADHLHIHLVPRAVARPAGRPVTDTINRAEIPDYLFVHAVQVFYFSSPVKRI